MLVDLCSVAKRIWVDGSSRNVLAESLDLLNLLGEKLSEALLEGLLIKSQSCHSTKEGKVGAGS